MNVSDILKIFSMCFKRYREIILEIVKKIKVSAKQIKENTPEILFLGAEAITGNPIACARLANLIEKMVVSIPDALFYSKLDDFLRGAFQSEEDRAKMNAFLATEGDKADNGMQILNHINNATSKQKVKYLVTATRFARAYDLPLALYFRICNAINVVMEDDLQFLSDNVGAMENVENNHFTANIHTQKLFSVSAMRTITTAWEAGDYAFTSFAKLIDICTVNFENDARYPNPRRIIEEYEEQED